mgnify:CR=1 FL=1
MKCVCEQFVMGVIVPAPCERGPHSLPQHVQQLRPHHPGRAQGRLHQGHVARDTEFIYFNTQPISLNSVRFTVQITKSLYVFFFPVLIITGVSNEVANHINWLYQGWL